MVGRSGCTPKHLRGRLEPRARAAGRPSGPKDATGVAGAAGAVRTAPEAAGAGGAVGAGRLTAGRGRAAPQTGQLSCLNPSNSALHAPHRAMQ